MSEDDGGLPSPEEILRDYGSVSPPVRNYTDSLIQETQAPAYQPRCSVPACSPGWEGQRTLDREAAQREMEAHRGWHREQDEIARASAQLTAEVLAILKSGAVLEALGPAILSAKQLGLAGIIAGHLTGLGYRRVRKEDRDDAQETLPGDNFYPPGMELHDGHHHAADGAMAHEGWKGHRGCIKVHCHQMTTGRTIFRDDYLAALKNLPAYDLDGTRTAAPAAAPGGQDGPDWQLLS